VIGRRPSISFRRNQIVPPEALEILPACRSGLRRRRPSLVPGVQGSTVDLASFADDLIEESLVCPERPDPMFANVGLRVPDDRVDDLGGQLARIGSFDVTGRASEQRDPTPCVASGEISDVRDGVVGDTGRYQTVDDPCVEDVHQFPVAVLFQVY